MYNRKEYIPYTLEEAVEICKKLYIMYTEAKVQVIRIGLQPTDTINKGKDVVAGPFHPAFRELVEGSILCDSIREKLKDKKEGTVRINSKDISKLYARGKFYFNGLLKEGYKIKVEAVSDIERGKIDIF